MDWKRSCVLGAFAALAAACGGDDTAATGGGGAPAGSGETTTSSTTSTNAMSSTTTSQGPTTTSGTGGASTTGTGTGGAGGQGGVFVPECIDSPDIVLAVASLDFGNAQTNGWAKIGFDIDGKQSTANSTDLCIPNKPSDVPRVYPDGDNGIDNSFAKNFVPFIEGQSPGFAQSVNDGITSGQFTLMLDLVGLTPDADQGPITARVYGAGSLGHAPAFDGTDCWPVTPESLDSPTQIDSAKTQFTMTQITANHLVSNVVDKMELSFRTDAGPITLTVLKARVSVDLAADHRSATNGQLGGVLETTVFEEEMEKVAVGQVGSTLCALVDAPIEDAADILKDGTQDPNAKCTGISIGLGFTLQLVKFGGITPAATPGNVVCNGF